MGRCFLYSCTGDRKVLLREGKEKHMQAAATLKMTNLEQIKGAIAAKMDSASFTSWIAPLQFEISGNELVLTAQNQFSADFIGSVHKNILNSVAEQFGLTVSICVRGANATSTIANDNNVQSYTPAVSVVRTQDTKVSAFDAFVCSDENAFVLSACKKLAAGSVSFSPLFIYGAAGCGKSLLVDCIEGATSGRVLKMSGGQFVSEFTRSLHDRTVFAFKDYCRNCDTFILDDVQALAGKRATCEEFAQLVMDLRAAGKNIVLTANVAPSNLNGFDRRFQSLMASGLVADVAAPNANVKRTILVRAGVSSEVAALIADRIAGDGHLVAGVATKIKTYTELMGQAVTFDVAQHLLADTLQKAKTPIAMVKVMCEKLGVAYEAVCGKGRCRAVALARQIMMAVLKEATNMSLTEIGRVCGDRDHATVVYAISQIEKLKKTDLVLAAQINQLIADCK